MALQQPRIISSSGVDVTGTSAVSPERRTQEPRGPTDQKRYYDPNIGRFVESRPHTRQGPWGSDEHKRRIKIKSDAERQYEQRQTYGYQGGVEKGQLILREQQHELLEEGYKRAMGRFRDPMNQGALAAQAAEEGRIQWLGAGILPGDRAIQQISRAQVPQPPSESPVMASVVPIPYVSSILPSYRRAETRVSGYIPTLEDVGKMGSRFAGRHPEIAEKIYSSFESAHKRTESVGTPTQREALAGYTFGSYRAVQEKPLKTTSAFALGLAAPPVVKGVSKVGKALGAGKKAAVFGKAALGVAGLEYTRGVAKDVASAPTPYAKGAVLADAMYTEVFPMLAGVGVSTRIAAARDPFMRAQTTGIRNINKDIDKLVASNRITKTHAKALRKLSVDHQIEFLNRVVDVKNPSKLLAEMSAKHTEYTASVYRAKRAQKLYATEQRKQLALRHLYKGKKLLFEEKAQLQLVPRLRLETVQEIKPVQTIDVSRVLGGITVPKYGIVKETLFGASMLNMFKSTQTQFKSQQQLTPYPIKEQKRIQEAVQVPEQIRIRKTVPVHVQTKAFEQAMKTITIPSQSQIQKQKIIVPSKPFKYLPTVPPTLSNKKKERKTKTRGLEAGYTTYDVKNPVASFEKFYKLFGGKNK